MTLIKPAYAQVTNSLRGAHNVNVSNIDFDANLGKLLTGGNISILELIFFGIGMIFFFNLLIAAWEYITAGGVPQAIQGATKRFLNSFLGIVVVLSSYLIIRIIGAIIGFDSGDYII